MKRPLLPTFDRAWREVPVLPCPDFEQFITDNNLLYRDLLFVSDLPWYIIPAGIHILEAQNYDDSPCYPIKFWAIIALPRYVLRALIPALLLPVGSCSDPDGFASHLSHHHFDPCAPAQHVSMGGHHAVPGSSYGGSPLTFKGSGSMGGGVLVAGL